MLEEVGKLTMIQDENGNPRLRSRQETLDVAGATTGVQTRPMLGAASGTQTNPDGTSTVSTTESLRYLEECDISIRPLTCLKYLE